MKLINISASRSAQGPADVYYINADKITTIYKPSQRYVVIEYDGGAGNTHTLYVQDELLGEVIHSIEEQLREP